MLIIPVEQKLDGNKPPVATVLLIIINCMVFFGYQTNDSIKLEQAKNYYIENDLYQFEYKVYKDYLQQKKPDAYKQFLDFEKQIDEEIKQQVITDKEKQEYFVVAIISNIEFTHYLNKQYFTENKTELKWMDARAELDSNIAKLSYLKYGLIPAELSIIDVFVSMFLHGDIGHLLGNMLFLFIYGFSLEIALGRLWYMGVYFLSGIGGGMMVYATSPESIIPTVGASGAVFGLLGMYLGLYGLKKIKFFFTVGFYVNYFKAPALVLLPYWGLIELYDQLTQQDNVAHFAHIGGLISGFLFVYFAKNRLIKIDREYVEKLNSEEPYLRLYDRFLRMVEKIEFAQARKTMVELLKMRPGDMRLLKHQFDLWKLKPASKNFELAAKQIFSQQKLSHGDTQLLVKLATEYEVLSENKSALDSRTRIHLFNAFLRADYAKEAVKQLDVIEKDPDIKQKLPAILLRLANYLFSRKQKSLAMEYIERIIDEFPASEAAREAKQFKHIS